MKKTKQPPPSPLLARQQNHYELASVPPAHQSTAAFLKKEVGVLETDKPTTAEIICTKGPYLNKTFVLRYTNAKHRWVFGRSNKTKKSKKSTTRFCLELDPSISGTHLEVRINNKDNGLEMTMKDLGSSNGTKLNGTKIVSKANYKVKVGDAFHLGRTSAFAVDRIGLKNVLSACPVCLCELQHLNEQERTTHVNNCLDGSGNSNSKSNSMNKKEQEEQDSSRALAVVLQNEPDALIVNGSGDTNNTKDVEFLTLKKNTTNDKRERCPVCNTDITFKSTESRNKHINRCVDRQMGISSSSSSSSPACSTLTTTNIGRNKKRKKQTGKAQPTTIEDILERASKLDQCILCSLPWSSSTQSHTTTSSSSSSSSTTTTTTSNTAHLRYCLSIRHKSKDQLIKMIKDKEHKSALSALGWGDPSQESTTSRQSSDFVIPPKKKRKTTKKKTKNNDGKGGKKTKEIKTSAKNAIVSSPLPTRYQLESTGTPISTRVNKLKRMIDIVDAKLSTLQRYRGALESNLKRVEQEQERNKEKNQPKPDVPLFALPNAGAAVGDEEEGEEEEGEERMNISSKKIRLDDSLMGSMHNSTRNLGNTARLSNALWKQAGSSQDPNDNLLKPLSPLSIVIEDDDEDDVEMTTLSQLVFELGSEEDDSDDDSILNESIGLGEPPAMMATSLRVQQWIQNAPTNFLNEFPNTIEQLNMLHEQINPLLIQHAIDKLSIVPLTPDNHQKEKCRQYMLTIMREMLLNVVSKDRSGEEIKWVVEELVGRVVNDHREEEDGLTAKVADVAVVEKGAEKEAEKEMQVKADVEEVLIIEDDVQDDILVPEPLSKRVPINTSSSSSSSSSSSTTTTTSSTKPATMPQYNEMEDSVLTALMESNGMKPRGRLIMIDHLTNIWNLSSSHKGQTNQHHNHNNDFCIDEENEDDAHDNNDDNNNDDDEQILESKLFQCIRSNDELYSDVLRYKVVECSRVQEIVSQEIPMRITKQQIRTFLDAQGITNSY